MNPINEVEVLQLLQSRTGRATRVVSTDGEPMEVLEVVQVSHPLNPDYCFYAEQGGIPLSADHGTYFFYTNEVGRIEDAESGEVIFTRQS